MNILVIIHNQSSTGPFFKVREMCVAISDVGNTVSLLCTSENARFRIKRYSYKNIQIIEAPDILWGKLRQGIDIWNIFNRLIFVTRNNYDIVHGIDCRPVVILPALLLKYFKKTKFVLSWWDLFGHGATSTERSGKLYSKTLGMVETLFEEYFRRFADSATVVSSFLQTKLGSLGYPSSRIELHRIGCNPIDLTGYNKLIIRKEFNFDENKIILCYVGTLFEKDKNLLIDSLRMLKKNITNFPLTIIVGNTHIKANICEELSIKLLGRIESHIDLRKILFSSDYALIPMKTSIANNARWPSKSADYWSVGLPVISTPISDYPTIFPQYNLGYLSKTDSPEDYSNAIYSAINSPKNVYQIKQNAIADFVKNELDWTVLGQRLTNLYKNILD